MATIDPPYRFDPWQNLVNVHWPEGGTWSGGYTPRTFVVFDMEVGYYDCIDCYGGFQTYWATNGDQYGYNHDGTISGMPPGYSKFGHFSNYGTPILEATMEGYVLHYRVYASVYTDHEYVTPQTADFSNVSVSYPGMGTYTLVSVYFGGPKHEGQNPSYWTAGGYLTLELL